MPSADLRSRADAFARTIRSRNIREGIAGAAVVAWFGHTVVAGEGLLHRVAAALLASAAVGVILRLLKRGAAPSFQGVADFELPVRYREALERQRDLLRGVTRWYVAPFIPGFVVSALDAGVLFAMPFLGVGVAIGLFVIWANNRAANALQREIDGI